MGGTGVWVSPGAPGCDAFRDHRTSLPGLSPAAGGTPCAVLVRGRGQPESAACSRAAVQPNRGRRGADLVAAGGEAAEARRVVGRGGLDWAGRLLGISFD